MTAKENRNKTAVLIECAILVALSVVLSMVKVYHLPHGGSITLLSMLPVCLISIRHGLKWGVGSAFVYSVIQFVLGIIFDGVLGWGLSAGIFIAMIIFDYLIAFTVLGLAGIFRKFGFVGIMLGTALAIFLRFVSHFISGWVLWTNLDAFEFFNISFSAGQPVLYSLLYNGSYMIPEMIFTMIAAPLVFKGIDKYLKSRHTSITGQNS